VTSKEAEDFLRSFRIHEPTEKEDPPSKERQPPIGKIPPGWKKFTSPEGGFTVLMPGDPKPRTDKSPGGVQTTYLAMDTKSKSAYSVSFQLTPPGVDPRDKKFRTAIFDQTAQGLSGATKGKIIKAEDIVHGELSGREYVVQAPGYFGVMRVYVVDNRFFIQVVGSTSQQETTTGASIFMPSLEVHDMLPGEKQPPSKQSKWREFTSKEDRFTIMMPSDPKISRQKGPGGGAVNTYVAATDANATVLVTVSDVPPKAQKSALDAAIKGYLSTAGAKVTRQQPVNMQKHQGQEIHFSNQFQTTGVARFFVIDNQVFTLAVTANAQSLPQEAQAFFNSFRTLGGGGIVPPKKKKF
jgi:hypothetical protein